MRPILLAVALTLVAPAAFAQSIALIIGNERYDETVNVRGADDLPRVADDLRDAGVRTLAETNADLSDIQAALSEFGQMAPQTDHMLVALSGRFVSTATETYFLPVEADGAPLAILAAKSLPLSTVTAWLAEADGRAVLILATDDRDSSYGPYLGDGLGDFEAPEGVTLVTGTPQNAARFLSRTVARPEASFRDGARRYGVRISGQVLEGDTYIDRASNEDSLAEALGSNRRESIAWRRATQDNTADAYRRYLDAYPEGQFSTMARNRLRSFDLSPEERAQRTEQALDLSREARRAIQRDLSILDYDTRGIDGIFGPGTRGAIRLWQLDNDRPSATGFLNREDIKQIGVQADRRAAELEAEAERRRAQLRVQDEAYWDETGALGGEDRLRAYLQRYPDGIFAERAQEDLDRIERRKAQRASARETADFDRVRAQDTIAAYRDFLDRHPNGAYARQARDRIAQLEAQASSQNSAAAAEEANLKLSPVTRQIFEQRLAALGIDPGNVDGRFDENTRRALRRYQQARGLPVTGYVTEAVVVRLLADSVRDVFD